MYNKYTYEKDRKDEIARQAKVDAIVKAKTSDTLDSKMLNAFFKANRSKCTANKIIQALFRGVWVFDSDSIKPEMTDEEIDEIVDFSDIEFCGGGKEGFIEFRFKANSFWDKKEYEDFVDKFGSRRLTTSYGKSWFVDKQDCMDFVKKHYKEIYEDKVKYEEEELKQSKMTADERKNYMIELALVEEERKYKNRLARQRYWKKKAEQTV